MWADLLDPGDEGVEGGFGFGAGVDAPGVEAEGGLFLEERGDGRVPFGFGVGVQHALDADVFVEPDGPAGGKRWGG